MVTGHRDSQVDRASGIGPTGAPALPSVSCLGAETPEVWEGPGRTGVGWGGSAYRGGAGGENVITRSSLLKVRHRLVGTEFMGEGVTVGRGWAGARRPPRSVPQSSTRSPWPQGREATDKYNTDPLPTPIAWRGGRRGDPESEDKGQVGGHTGEARKADVTRRQPVAVVTAFASGQARLFSPWPRGQGPLLPGPPVSQTNPAPPLSPSQNLCTHLSLLQQGPGPSPTTKVDKWMHGWTE